MDEGRLPGETKNKIFFLSIIILIQAVIFSIKIKCGIFIILGLLIFMMAFSNMNKSEMKKDMQKSLKYSDEWYVSKRELSKEIP